MIYSYIAQDATPLVSGASSVTPIMFGNVMPIIKHGSTVYPPAIHIGEK